jgi:hypothetical protein
LVWRGDYPLEAVTRAQTGAPSSTASEGNGTNDWVMLEPQKDVDLRYLRDSPHDGFGQFRSLQLIAAKSNEHRPAPRDVTSIWLL